MTEPLTEIAQDTALGPGTGTIFMLAFCACSTSRAPGSDIPGVPASEM